MAERAKVLVKERIADAGVELLRERFDVELGLDWDDGELERRIGEFDGILIRSATQLDAGLIEKGERLRVIGRAGTGVDNVDIEAATKRGIVVANAPEANSIAAAEHTVAVMLALCRNVPQAHGSLAGGRLGALALQGRGALRQDARRARLRPHRPARRPARQGLRDARSSATTSSSPPSASASSASRASRPPRSSTSGPTSSPCTCRRRPRPINFIDAEAIAAMREGVRIVNCARGELVDLDALLAGLESGKVARRRAGRLPRGALHRPPDPRRARTSS